jgi:hypothetical protein
MYRMCYVLGCLRTEYCDLGFVGLVSLLDAYVLVVDYVVIVVSCAKIMMHVEVTNMWGEVSICDTPPTLIICSS